MQALLTSWGGHRADCDSSLSGRGHHRSSPRGSSAVEGPPAAAAAVPPPAAVVEGPTPVAAGVPPPVAAGVPPPAAAVEIGQTEWPRRSMEGKHSL